MAAATPGNQQGIQFEQIIQGILSTDNTIRAAAEEYFKRVKTQPDVCISQLMATLEQSQALDSRNLCAVLLRKVLQQVVCPCCSIIQCQTPLKSETDARSA